MINNKLPFFIRLIKKVVNIIFSIVFLPIYHLIGFIPRNNRIWIFSSWFGQKYSDNSRIFYEYINKFHPEIKAVWISKDKEIVKKIKQNGYFAAYSKSINSLWYLFRAKKIFTTSGEEVSLALCNGIEYYALWHGMPLKKILLDAGFSSRKSKKMILKEKCLKTLRVLFPWSDFIDQKEMYTITNSDFFVQYLKTAFNLPEEKILKTGSPRCDALFQKKDEPLVSQIKQEFPDSKIFLYMPTFRTSSWTGKIFKPFTNEFGFDEKEFFQILDKKNIVFLYKPHFSDAAFMDSIDVKKIDSRFIAISDECYDELYSFISHIDVLVTDYSSIYFDFIATNKPVILTPFDYADYVKNAREHYFNYFDNMEGVKANNWSEFVSILENDAYQPVSPYTKHRFSEYLDGECCKKLTHTVFSI